MLEVYWCRGGPTLECVDSLTEQGIKHGELKHGAFAALLILIGLIGEQHSFPTLWSARDLTTTAQ